MRRLLWESGSFAGWRSLAISCGLALAFSLSAAQSGKADTIVLKNGRRISALSVTEDGDKVRYQTVAGELTLPKSIVDHIERGPAEVMPDSPAASASNLAMTPPVLESDAEIEKATVHDGEIDRNYCRERRARPDREAGRRVSVRRARCTRLRNLSWRTATWSVR